MSGIAPDVCAGKPGKINNKNHNKERWNEQNVEFTEFVDVVQDFPDSRAGIDLFLAYALSGGGP